MDTLILNSLYADVERLERINDLVDNQSSEQAPFKYIEHLIISPTQDIADIAIKHYKSLPRAFRIALTFLGLNRGNSRRFMSYLMFIEPFCQELIALGYKDAMDKRSEVETFLGCGVK
jgi:NTE family protein